MGLRVWLEIVLERFVGKAYSSQTMSLKELQTSISQLPRPDRESLLRFLGQQLAEETQGSRPAESPQAVTLERSQWIEDLRQLRESVTTGAHGTPLSEILDDLRADRA